MKKSCASFTVVNLALAIVLSVLPSGNAIAIDSYRYLHVSIETPWMIFLFLLVAVFVPFILMLVLMWRPTVVKQIPPAKREPPPHD